MINVHSPKIAGPVGSQDKVETEETVDQGERTGNSHTPGLEEGEVDREETEKPTDHGEIMDQGEETLDSPSPGHEVDEDGIEGDFTNVQTRKRLRSKELVNKEKPKAQTEVIVSLGVKESKNKQLMLELDEKKRRIREKL